MVKKLADVVKNITSPSLYLWLDPGKTTGWAIWSPITRQFYSNTITGVTDTANMVDDTIECTLGGPTMAAVGWEPFTIRPGSAHLDLDTEALEVIGAVKWIIKRSGAITLKPQQPSDRSLGMKHLKVLEWHRPGPDHADSAASHLLSYLIDGRLLPADMMSKIINSGT